MVEPRSGSERAIALAARLREAAAALIDVIEPIETASWRDVPKPGVWSIGKDAEHVADAAAYHQWIMRRTVGKASSRRPVIERDQMVSDRSPEEAVALIRRLTDEGRTILLDLTDEQLDQPTRPPRAGGQLLEETIERVLIGHYDVHRAAIEGKLRLLTEPSRHARGR